MRGIRAEIQAALRRHRADAPRDGAAGLRRCRRFGGRLRAVRIQIQVLRAGVTAQLPIADRVKAVHTLARHGHNRAVGHRRQRGRGRIGLLAQLEAAVGANRRLPLVLLGGLNRRLGRRGGRRCADGGRGRRQRFIRHIDVIAADIARHRAEQHRQHAVVAHFAGDGQHRALRQHHDDAGGRVRPRAQVQPVGGQHDGDLRGRLTAAVFAAVLAAVFIAVRRVRIAVARVVDDVIVHHIAAERAILHIRPVGIALQHRERLAVAQAREHGGVGRRRGAQVKRLALVGERDRRRAAADHAGGRFVHAVLLHDQVRGHHIAGQCAVLHAAPFALPAEQVDLCAVRHARQDGGGRRRPLAQVEAVQRVFERHHGGLRVRNRLIRGAGRGGRAVHAAKQRARHGVARARQAGIIKFENLVVGKALVGHLLRAALAHAHAVAEAPRRQLIAADGLRHGQRLVFEHVDGHGAEPLHL